MPTHNAINGKMAKRHKALTAFLKAVSVLSLGLLANASFADGFCPSISQKGVMSNLNFMPAFLHADAYSNGTGLTISSFLNANRNVAPATGFTAFQRDLTARIPKINSLNYSTFNPTTNVEILTDLDLLSGFQGRTVWPNDSERVPTGVLPFEGVILPQGFLSAALPGRLSIINMNSITRQEYIVHQSTQTGPFTTRTDPLNSPRAYHRAIWIDMNGDGKKDLVTVRSGFRVGTNAHPPSGELVYFINPGAAINPTTPWQQVTLYKGTTANSWNGPDINLDAADLDNDGKVEIVATSFLSNGQVNGKITILGAPVGGTWAQVNVLAVPAVFSRAKIISADQGSPFDVQIVDLNNDGKKDILATNHQPDNCGVFNSDVPGRVYALEAPADGNLFVTAWTTHILKDNIRPQPSMPGSASPGRLAPGKAIAFNSVKYLEGIAKPDIVVGGDQAGKVWLLRSQDPADSANWNYDSAVIFDINAYYGANTTQTFIPVGQLGSGRENSTIGGLAVAYNRAGLYGVADIYVPVYEGRAIHVLSYAFKDSYINCTADENFACSE